MAGRTVRHDVVVVGAGPAGSAAAYHLAKAGVEVAALDKARFPRDKTCGDGLTPKAVRELVAMGFDTSRGFHRVKGLHVFGGGHELFLDWPQLASQPDFGLVSRRHDFDTRLVEHARAAGAEVIEGADVTGPITNSRGRVIGVEVERRDENGRRTGKIEQHLARIVIAADGASSRLGTALGMERAANRPMGVAARTYFRTPRADEDYMVSHLELWDGEPGHSNLLPGYGWIFPLGDGTANVGLGSVKSSAKSAHLDYKKLLTTWTKATPVGWGFTAENQIGPVRSAPLPMALSRQPLYRSGVLLVGDAGGMVSPFNGEGIAYALQAGRLAAETSVQALGRTTLYAHVRTLRDYPQLVKSELGGYFTLGRVFVQLIEHPEVMHVCTKYGLPRPLLMRFTMKLLADLYEPRGGDALDRLIVAMTRMVPKA